MNLAKAASAPVRSQSTHVQLAYLHVANTCGKETNIHTYKNTQYVMNLSNAISLMSCVS